MSVEGVSEDQVIRDGEGERLELMEQEPPH